MSELLGRLQSQTSAGSTIATASSYPPHEWVQAWIWLEAERLLSYAAEDAVL